MAVQTATITAGATASILFHNTLAGASVRVLITSHNNSADVYVGGASVTPTSNGIVVPKSTNIYLDVPAGETLYCAGNGTDTLKYLCFV